LLLEHYSDIILNKELLTGTSYIMQTIDLNQAKQQLPKLIEQTIQGDDVVITKGGQPIVRLVAFVKQGRKQRLFGGAKGLIRFADDFDTPLEDFKEYM
jgi:prevent-host-death family protein